MGFEQKDDYEIHRNGNLISVEKASRALRKHGRQFVFDTSADIEIGDLLINQETKDEYYVKDKETRKGHTGLKKIIDFETKAQHDRYLK